MSERKLEIRRRVFDEAMRAGIAAAAKVILKTSAKCTKAVKDAPIGELALNLDETLNVFVKARGDSTLMRYEPMAERIAFLVLREKSKTFTIVDDTKKLRRLGESFGFMTGTAVMTSVVKVFINQAVARLSATELSDNAKTLCLAYCNDAFTLVLMAMTALLDGKYSTSPRERKFFASILTSNEWVDEPKAESKKPLESVKDPKTSSQS